MNIQDVFLCPICKSIPDKDRESFLKQLSYQLKTYKKGDLIANQGDRLDFLYILMKGRVKTEMISESGVPLNIETISAPMPLAPAFLFAEENRFPVDVIALEDAEVLLISKSSVMQLLATNEAFLQAYMSYNSNRTQFLSERIRLLSIKTIKGKLAYYILERAKGLSFEMDRSQTDLAEYFGVARPSLARSWAELIEDGIIVMDKKSGKILDIDQLKTMVLL